MSGPLVFLISGQKQSLVMSSLPSTKWKDRDAET